MEQPITLDDIDINEASLSEANEAGKVEHDQLAEAHEASVPTLKYSQESARKFFMSPSNTFYIARIRDTGRLVAGGGLAMWLCPYFYNRSFVLAVYTEKEVRRIKLSSLLQFKFIQKIQEENSNYIEVMIHKDNRASVNSAMKSSSLTGFQDVRENALKVAFYGSYPDLPATWNDFVSAFEKNYIKYDRFVEKHENLEIQEEKNLRIIWNFEAEFDQIYEESMKLDWSNTTNIVEVNKTSKLSNKKLEIFYGRLQSQKGTTDYDNQVMGLIIENNKVEGLVYLSNYLHICLGARFLTLSEITLFDPKKILNILPFVFRKVHVDLAKKYLIHIFMVIIPEQESSFKDLYLETSEKFGLEDYSYRVLSQSKPYHIDANEKL